METQRMKKKTKWILTALAVVLILPLISLGKYALYELSGAAPTLRDSIGKTAILPEQIITGSLEPKKATLKKVNYRWNDKIGFFDLAIEYSGENGE